MTNDDKSVIERLLRSDEAHKGRLGEAVAKWIFKWSGFTYTALADIDCGGAPCSHSQNGKVVLPDFDVAGELFTVYIDAKCKTGPIHWRRNDQWRHGIDKRNYLAYRKQAEIYRKRWGIFLVELFQDFENPVDWSGRLLAESLDNLGQPFDGESNQQHMVYWKSKMFSDLDSVSPSDLVAIANGKLQRSYRLEFESIFARYRQPQLFE